MKKILLILTTFIVALTLMSVPLMKKINLMGDSKV